MCKSLSTNYDQYLSPCPNKVLRFLTKHFNNIQSSWKYSFCSTIVILIWHLVLTIPWSQQDDGPVFLKTWWCAFWCYWKAFSSDLLVILVQFHSILRVFSHSIRDFWNSVVSWSLEMEKFCFLINWSPEFSLRNIS